MSTSALGQRIAKMEAAQHAMVSRPPALTPEVFSAFVENVETAVLALGIVDFNRPLISPADLRKELLGALA